MASHKATDCPIDMRGNEEGIYVIIYNKIKESQMHIDILLETVNKTGTVILTPHRSNRAYRETSTFLRETNLFC